MDPGLTAVTAGQPFLTDTIFIIIYAMTTKEIMQAIRSGQTVVLRDDPMSHICEDFFAGLVVVSLQADVPTRLATLDDYMKAIINN